MRCAVAVVLAAASATSIAHADDRLVWEAGANLRYWRDRSATGYGDLPDPQYDPGKHGLAGGIEGSVAVRVAPSVAFGLRLDPSWERYTELSSGMHDDDTFTLTRIPIDVALTAIYSRDVFRIAPWIGARPMFTHALDTRCFDPGLDRKCETVGTSNRFRFDGAIGGISIGLDFWGQRRIHAGPVLDVSAGTGGYRSVGVGIAIRR